MKRFMALLIVGCMIFSTACAGGPVPEQFSVPLVASLQFADSVLEAAWWDIKLPTVTMYQSGTYSLELRLPSQVSGLMMLNIVIKNQDEWNKDSSNLKGHAVQIMDIQVDGVSIYFEPNYTYYTEEEFTSNSVDTCPAIYALIWDEDVLINDYIAYERYCWDGSPARYDRKVIVGESDFESYKNLKIVFSYGKFQ